MLRPRSQAYKEVSDYQKKKTSVNSSQKYHKWQKKYLSYPRLLTLVAHPLAIYPPVAILLSTVSAITEQYNYFYKNCYMIK